MCWPGRIRTRSGLRCGRPGGCARCCGSFPRRVAGLSDLAGVTAITVLAPGPTPTAAAQLTEAQLWSCSAPPATARPEAPRHGCAPSSPHRSCVSHPRWKRRWGWRWPGSCAVWPPCSPRSRNSRRPWTSTSVGTPTRRSCAAARPGCRPGRSGARRVRRRPDPLHRCLPGRCDWPTRLRRKCPRSPERRARHERFWCAVAAAMRSTLDAHARDPHNPATTGGDAPLPHRPKRCPRGGRRDGAVAIPHHRVSSSLSAGSCPATHPGSRGRFRMGRSRW